ncbi:hypothetical protein GOP47_0027493 [Adiantum capillus-veneris]|nr:hypothetical protein GOP47_0027493 [Adiantum capillus-veneris]
MAYRQHSPESGHQSDEESGGHYGGGGDSVKEQDRLLPIANVSRIMKRALPANAKISKDAKETLQECVSEFISFITGEASDKCQREKRKTVNGDDLLWAMSTLGFEDYIEPLKLYLQKYRELEGNYMYSPQQHQYVQAASYQIPPQSAGKSSHCPELFVTECFFFFLTIFRLSSCNVVASLSHSWTATSHDGDLNV